MATLPSRKTPTRRATRPAAPVTAAAARPVKPARAAAPAEPPPPPNAAKADKPPKAPKPPKSPKLRQKPVRDSFTMPEPDFALIGTLKARALAAGRETKKSELLRAGLQALSTLDTPALMAALGRLEPVKVGRPKKGH